MKRPVTWALTVLAGTIGALPILAPTAGRAQPRTVEVAPGTFVAHPATWARAEAQYSNAVELVVPAEKPGEGLDAARLVITTERRRDHAEAVRRLAEIAAEADAPFTVLEIGGWPAVERRYLAPVPRRGQGPGGEALALRVTTAIGAGELVVRLETLLAPGADPTLADQAEAIGRSAAFPSRGTPEEVGVEIRALRERLLPPPAPPEGPGSSLPPGESPPGEGVPGAAVKVQTALGELEIAVSNDGQNVVVAGNSGFSFSSNGGGSFTLGGTSPPASFPRDGDSSLAVGQSGAFYYGFIGFPDGSAAALGFTGCSTGMSVSTNNGQSFTFRNHAVRCPQSGSGLCFPDQEHIAADRVNAAAGADQVYSVWRNFTSASATTCSGISSGSVTPSIVCSKDSGNTWTAPAAIGSGDIPRITVGANGFAYVVYRSGSNLMLHKFSSCAAGLVPQVGFPVTVASVTDVACPVPGLDRCNNGNLLSSHMVAVDDTNSNHLYIAYATNTASGNENIVVRDSTDGGATWPRAITVNTATSARRFMPWVCSVGGAAHVSWYDRRAATAGNNDLTDYFVRSVTVQGGTLKTGPEVNLSVNPDPQCASDWPCGCRATTDAESCSVQPQLAGFCSISGARCDFSVGCPTGAGTCNTASGCPKYGDYNGNACVAGRIYTAWASATSPPGLAAATGITIFSSTLTAATLIPSVWTEVSGSGLTPSSPAAVLDGSTLRLFVRGTDNRIYLNSGSGGTFGTWSEVPPGGGLTPNQPAAVLDSSGTLRLFVQGVDFLPATTNSRIYMNTRMGGTWSGWGEVPGGGLTPSGPEAVLDGSTLRLFVRGTDNRIYTSTP